MSAVQTITCNRLQGPALRPPIITATFTNTSNSTTTTQNANTSAPIPGFGLTSSTGDSTILASFNKSTAVFTAPYNCKVTFVGWQQWQAGYLGNSYNFNINSTTSYSGFAHGGFYVGITPFNHFFNMTTNQTAQLVGGSNAAWGTYANSLTIYVERTQ